MARPDDDIPRRRRGPVLLATAGLAAIVAIAVSGALGAWREAQRAALAPEVAAARASAAAAALPPAPLLRLSVVTARLGRNQTVAQALHALHLAPAQVKAVLAALTDIFPFHRARPGDQIRVERCEGDQSIQRLTYRQGRADEWNVLASHDGSLRGEKRPVELRTTVERVAVTIQSSLYETLQKAGEDPALAVSAADVLAWDVDFYQDVRAGDTMKIVVEKVTADGKLLRYGDVLAAEYDGSSVGRKRLFRYTDPTGQTSYYDDEGNSARRGFLKSPLKYAHVTSGYGIRFHPLLQYMKAHQGVDYGAPVGTPVWAVGDATVQQAGWNGGCGKSVTLRHRNGLETVYCHLNAVAVRSGTRVAQKQIVGYVGSTGLSTGPHLHYAVKRGGAFLNPLSLKLPREAPVAREHRGDFAAKIAPLRAQLDGALVASARGSPPSGE